MPSTAVYLVLPALIALIAASLMLSGVSKSGSPAPSPITSRPAALSARALSVTAIVADGLMRCSDSARNAIDVSWLLRGLPALTGIRLRAPARPKAHAGEPQASSAPNPKFACLCRESDCELRVQRGTRITGFASVLSIPKFASSVLQGVANFGIVTIEGAQFTARAHKCEKKEARVLAPRMEISSCRTLSARLL